MQNILPVLCFIAGFALAWLVLRWRKHETESAFKALSADALARNNQAFLDLARATLAQTQEAARGRPEMRQQAIVELVAPVRNSLDKVDSQIQELEKARAGAYAALHEQVRGLLETQTQLRAETGKLVTALRTPGVRGRGARSSCAAWWRWAGNAGPLRFRHAKPPSLPTKAACAPICCATARGQDHPCGRQDAARRLPPGHRSPDEQTRKARLADHARQVRAHLTALGRKSYWEQFEHAPEFAVLFLPGECFFSAALRERPLAHRIPAWSRTSSWPLPPP